MTFDEVNTLYHEMGHGLQHMLTKVEDGDAAGINGVEWDAVELPSQFMENWLLDRPTLYGFAKHYETGEPLPHEFYAVWKSTSELGYTPSNRRGRGENVASMAWNRHAIEQTWGARI
jgi:oligopeptidase A